MNCGSNITLIDKQYICLSCDCSNGFKFNDNIKVKYYKKLFYNRKYHLEKYIKKYENYENFDRIKVILLFCKIINETIGLNIRRKRTFKFTLILGKVFEILQYKIEIPNDNKEFNNIYK